MKKVTQPQNGRGREAIAVDLGRLAGLSGVACSREQVEALIQFGELLLAWTQRINLTAARSLGALVGEHFPDSFVLASALAGGGRLVDVGSGGGLPALPLAVLVPALHVTLVEPVAKKAAFLRTAVRELGLGQRVVVEGRRAEELAPGSESSFDAATARAVWAPEEWCRVGVRLVRPGGQVFVLASADPTLEVEGLVRKSTRSYLGGRRWLVGLERVS